MRPIRSLLIYLLAVFLGGALLAPWFYKLVQAVLGSEVIHVPFHRYVNRSLIVVALIGMWPLLRSLGATSLREVGIVKPVAGRWKLFVGGFLLGFGSLACVALIVLSAHGRQFNSHLSLAQFSRGVAEAAGTAIIVAVMEEILFRGAIFGALRKVWNWRAALLVSSMIYAIVHFLQSADLPGQVNWSSGLKLLPHMLRGFGNWDVVIPAFFSLTLIGILLGLAYQRTGTLYCSIGMHAGWIFWLRAFGMLTMPTNGEIKHWFLGTQKLTDGWLTFYVLALVLLVFVLVPWRKPPSSPP